MEHLEGQSLHGELHVFLQTSSCHRRIKIMVIDAQDRLGSGPFRPSSTIKKRRVQSFSIANQSSEQSTTNLASIFFVITALFRVSLLAQGSDDIDSFYYESK